MLLACSLIPYHLQPLHFSHLPTMMNDLEGLLTSSGSSLILYHDHQVLIQNSCVKACCYALWKMEEIPSWRASAEQALEQWLSGNSAACLSLQLMSPRSNHSVWCLELSQSLQYLTLACNVLSSPWKHQISEFIAHVRRKVFISRTVWSSSKSQVCSTKVFW
jgi:hypothetical protein